MSNRGRPISFHFEEGEDAVTRTQRRNRVARQRQRKTGSKDELEAKRVKRNECQRRYRHRDKSPAVPAIVEKNEDSNPVSVPVVVEKKAVPVVVEKKEVPVVVDNKEGPVVVEKKEVPVVVEKKGVLVVVENKEVPVVVDKKEVPVVLVQKEVPVVVEKTEVPVVVQNKKVLNILPAKIGLSNRRKIIDLLGSGDNGSEQKQVSTPTTKRVPLKKLKKNLQVWQCVCLFILLMWTLQK